MPNWTTNVIVFKEGQDLSELKEFLRNKERGEEESDTAISFNNFYPEPEELKYTSSYNFNLLFPSMLLYLLDNMKDKKDIKSYVCNNNYEELVDRLFGESLNLRFYNTEDKNNKSSIIEENNQNFLKLWRSYKHEFILHASLIKNLLDDIKTRFEYKVNKSNISDNPDWKIYYNLFREAIKDNIITYCEQLGYSELYFAGLSKRKDGTLYSLIENPEILKVMEENSKPIDYPVILEIGKFYYNIINNYGCLYWYDYHLKYWGTKWDACYSFWISDNVLSFDTAWSAPIPIFDKFKELFQDLEFDIYALYEFEADYVKKWSATPENKELIEFDDNYYSDEQLKLLYQIIIDLLNLDANIFKKAYEELKAFEENNR